MFQKILDLIFIKKCFSCGKSGDYLCDDCFYDKLILQKNCFLCVDKDNGSKLKNCNKCRENIVFDGVLSFFNYHDKSIKSMIKSFKFCYAYDIGRFFGERIGDIVSKKYILDDSYILVPVPLSKKRLNYRGFNQSYIFAKAIAERTGLKIYNDVLIKGKNTINQVGLKESARIKNLKNTFFVKYDKLLKYDLFNKNVILVDDVITTGKTASNCVKELKKNGFKKVFVLTIART